MSLPETSDLESRLAEELEQEVRIAMAMTDTAVELARFRTRTHRLQIRGRVLTAAAALVVIAAVAIAATIIGSGAPKPTQSVRLPAPRIPLHLIIKHRNGPATPLPAEVHVTKLRGPENLGTLAFGDLWATTGRHGVRVLPHATLYRISADGSRVLSTTSYPPVNDNQPDPVRVGNTIVVADRSGGYSVVNPTGQLIGSLASTSALGAVAGDSSGGWIATKPNEIAQVDVTGLHIDHTFALPLKAISGLAVSAGAIWVTDESLDQLVRVNPSTGAITGRTQFSFAPTQVRYINGAVYVATSDDYGIHRVDPSTMTVTATAVGSGLQSAQPTVLVSYNGQVWTQALGGTVTRLNPVTLRTEITTRLFPELSYITNGAVIGESRTYVVDGEVNTLYSYPAQQH